MENNTVFSANNLSFAYADKPILSNINFSIKEGKITTLMGANGCGKSTLFQLLTKNLEPSLGNIYLNNVDISQIPIKEFAQNVAIVHQYNTAPDDLTVYQLVSYGRTPYKKVFYNNLEKDIDTQEIIRAMKMTGIYKFRNRTIHSLSGGQKQRVWIAMALAQDTKILLLDEPTTYLDVRYQLQILRLVKDLNRQLGITVLMVLHDINQALTYSDEIIALSSNGELLVKGNPNEVIVPEIIKEMYGVSLQVVEINEHPFVLTV